MEQQKAFLLDHKTTLTHILFETLRRAHDQLHADMVPDLFVYGGVVVA